MGGGWSEVDTSDSVYTHYSVIDAVGVWSICCEESIGVERPDHSKPILILHNIIDSIIDSTSKNWYLAR